MLAMKRRGGLSRLVFSTGIYGSEIPASATRSANNSCSEGFDNNQEDNLVEENDLFDASFLPDAGELLSLPPQKSNYEDLNAFSKTEYIAVCNEDSAFPFNGSQSSQFSSKAPAMLETGYEQAVDAREEYQPEKVLSRSHNSSFVWRLHARSEPMEIARKEKHFDKAWRKLQKQKSWSTESSRNEAWERRRDLYLSEELKNMKDDGDSKALGRCISDCGERTWPRKQSTRFRTRTLTDDDLEELRGCIDLGFGFGNKEDTHLCNTLPALELCYAIERKLPSPTLMSDGGLQNSSSLSTGSSQSSPEGTWRISSPGDNPQQVKTRLRHWAQAVACSVRQSC